VPQDTNVQKNVVGTDRLPVSATLVDWPRTATSCGGCGDAGGYDFRTKKVPLLCFRISDGVMRWFWRWLARNKQNKLGTKNVEDDLFFFRMQAVGNCCRCFLGQNVLGPQEGSACRGHCAVAWSGGTLAVTDDLCGVFVSPPQFCPMTRFQSLMVGWLFNAVAALDE
jgi:hypothetical protein